MEIPVLKTEVVTFCASSRIIHMACQPPKLSTVSWWLIGWGFFCGFFFLCVEILECKYGMTFIDLRKKTIAQKYSKLWYLTF